MCSVVLMLAHRPSIEGCVYPAPSPKVKILRQTNRSWHLWNLILSIAENTTFEIPCPNNSPTNLETNDEGNANKNLRGRRAV